MRLIILVIVLMAGLIMAGKKDNQYITRLVYSVDSVEVVEQDSGFIKFRTLSSVPDPCYTFSHVDSKITENEIAISLFARRDKDVNCIQIIGRMQAEFKIKIPSRGKYVCTFLGDTKNKSFAVESE